MPTLLVDDDSLAVGVTSRSRRRRKPKPAVSPNNNTSADEKENAPAEPRAKTKTTKKPASKKAATSRRTVMSKESPCADPSALPCAWTYSSYEPKKDTLRRFRAALDKVPVEEVAEWKTDDALSKSLVEASLCLPQQQQAESTSTIFYVLEEESTNKEILSTCRKIVKQAAAGHDSKDVEATVYSLFASVHGLRALSAIPPETTRSEAILRLLYHVITTGSSLLNTLHQQIIVAKATNKKANNKLEKLVELTEVACFAGYQALCHILLHFSVSTGTSNNKIAFEYWKGDDDDDEKHPISPQWSCLFPVPRLYDNKSSNRPNASSSMTPSQIFTISVQSTLAIARMMANTTCSTAGPFSCFRNNIQEEKGAKDDPPRVVLPPAQAAAVYLLQTVGLSWACRMSSYSKDKDGTMAKETVSFCQQAHRILWELASRISKKEQQQYKELCLKVRKHALLMLLAQSELSTIQLDLGSSTGKYLRKKHFDNICTMAWKASTNYATQQQQQTLPERSPLLHFHASLGSMLDTVAGYQPETTESLPYAEYCAYRALHVGSSLEGGSTTSSCQHKTSSKSACMLAEFPFKYTHPCSLVESATKETNNHELPYSVALCTFFVILQLRNHLRQNLPQLHRDMDAVDGFCSSKIDPAQARAIIQCFQSSFLHNDEAKPVEVLLGCFKLLTLVPLHSTIFELSSISPQDLVEQLDIEELRIAAEVLATCIGPFTHVLLARGASQDAKKLSCMWDLVVESFARAAVLWDILHSIEVANDVNSVVYSDAMSQSDSAMLNLVDIFAAMDSGSISVRSSLVEKSAKIFASLGKRRASRNEKEFALVPLLHSLSLFSELASDSNGSEHNMSARWSMIAGTFQSIGWNDAASLASAVTVTCDFISVPCANELEGGDDVFNDIVDSLGSHTHGIVETGYEILAEPDKNRLHIRRLVNNLLEKEEDHASVEAATTCNPLSGKGVIHILLAVVSEAHTSSERDAMLASLYKKQLDQDFTLVGVLRALSYKGSGLDAMIQLLASILAVMGKTIQRACDSPSEKTLTAYEEVTNLLVELICALPHSQSDEDADISTSVLRATAYIAASSCILADCQVFDHISIGIPVASSENLDDHSATLLPLATKFATQAWEVVSNKKQDRSDKGLLLSAVRSTASIYLHNLSELNGSNNTAACKGNVVAAVDERSLSLLCSTKLESTTTEMALSCMRWTLSRLRDRLSLQGDRLLASQVAIWHRSISTTSGQIYNQWSSAMTTSVLLASGLFEVAFNAQQIEEGNAGGSESELQLTGGDSETLACWRILAAAERQMGDVRLKLCCADTTDTTLLEEQLHEELSNVESFQPESNHDVLVASKSVVRASILFALSEADEASGDIHHALSRVRMCFRACQEVVASENLLNSKALDLAADGLSRMILPTLVIRSLEKQIECLQRTAYLYAALGDHRRCEAYSLSALKSSDNQGTLAKLKPKVKLAELLSMFRNNAAGSRQEESSRRKVIWLKATATASDLVADDFLNATKEIKPLLAGSNTTVSVVDPFGCDKLGEINDFFIVGNYFHVSSASKEKIVDQLYGRASVVYESMVSEAWFQKLSESVSPSSPPDRLLAPVFFELQLGEIRSLLAETSALDSSKEKEAAALCLSITKSKLAPRHCRTWAFYYLGLLELRTARKTGALTKLWSGFSNIDEDPCGKKRRSAAKCVKNARNYFLAAVSLLGPASELLTRQVLRSLALVTGPETGSEISALSACILIHTSIGCTARQALRHSYSTNADGWTSVLGALDISFTKLTEREHQVDQLLTRLGQCAQPGWRFVASSLCPTGEILLTSLEMDAAGLGLQAETTCVFPSASDASRDILCDNHTYDEIIKPLDSLILKSQQQLRGIATSSDANEKFNDTSAKRGWWNARKETDTELHDLLGGVERNCFDSRSVRQALFGCDESPFLDDSIDSSCSDISTSMFRGDLTSRFDAVSHTPRKSSRSSSSKVKFAPENDFTDKPTSVKRGRKSRSHRRASSTGSSFSASTSYQQLPVPLRTSLPAHCNSEGASCTILILDENLHRVPMEGLPSFANRSVCRLPSLPFALATFYQSSQSQPVMPAIDPANGSYILDPEANLGATRERLLPFIEELTQRRSWKWNGVVGETPSPDFMEQSLQQENGLLLYCGHGGGQTCFSRTQVEGLMNGREQGQERSHVCRSSVVLMGCSSGRLESINRKGSDALANQPIFYEPEGIVISYLLSGAPCVVANLWDVTDHDIDRYCLNLLERFLDSPSDKSCSMAQAVAEARTACKMPYIVGCAPVCYGLPIHLLQSRRTSSTRAGLK